MMHIKSKGHRLATLLGLSISAIVWGGSANAAECSYEVTNSWTSGFTGAITITNNGNSTINGWNVNWKYNKNSISNAWNARLSGSYSASNMSWNAAIAPGQSVSFGFQGDANGGEIETPIISGDVCGSTQPPASSSSAQSSTVSSVSSSLSSIGEQCAEMCQWYQDAPRPLCNNQSSGWGYENGQSCIGRTTCESQSGDGGVISSCATDSSSSSSSVLPPASSSSSSSIPLPSSSSSSSSSEPLPSSSSSSSSSAPLPSSSSSSSSSAPLPSSSSSSSSSEPLPSSSSSSSSSSSLPPVSSSSSSSSSEPYVPVDGHFRVDATGNITKDGDVLPVRCGSWFGLEGQHEPKNASSNPDGAPLELYMGNMWWANGGQGTGRTIQQTMDEITALGINVVRFPIAPQTLDPTDPQGIGAAQYGGVLKNHSSVMQNNARQAMEDFIKLADQNGIDLIIDIHSCSNYVGWRAGRLDAKPPYADAERINYDFTREGYSCSATGNPSSVKQVDAYNEAKWLENLKEIASLQSKLGVDNIMAIDIFNEPWDYTWAEWKDLAEKAFDTIAAENDDVLIMVEGIAGGTGAGIEVPHGDESTNPNWGENFYPAANAPLDIPKDRLIISPHTYGPSVFVQKQFIDQSQPGCAGLEGDAAAEAKCNIVIKPDVLESGWEEHFGFLRDEGYAMIIGEFGGAIDWPAGAENGVNWTHVTDKVDEQWQNAFVDYMIDQNIQGCYWSINPESADTGGLYKHAYVKGSNESGWGEWLEFDERKTSLIKRLWDGLANGTYEPPVSSSSSTSSASSVSSSSEAVESSSSESSEPEVSSSSSSSDSSVYSSEPPVISSSSSSESSTGGDDSLVLYNGESKPFSAASGWDGNGSTIGESSADPASGSNHLRLELNVSGWWGAGAYVPNDWTPLDLSNVSAITFKAKANTATGLSLWLWDSGENQSVDGSSVALGTSYQQYSISLEGISDGVSMDSINAFLFASSGLEEGEVVVDIDDIAMVMGGTSSSTSSSGSTSSVSNTQIIVYNGESHPFADASAWDANGTSMSDSSLDPASGTNHLRATLVIADWWGGAAYVPGNWSPVDWTGTDYLKFKAKADAPMSISVGLFDSAENQTESPVIVSIGTEYQEYSIDMQDLAMGVAMDSLNAVVFAGSGISSGTYTLDIDDILLEIDNSQTGPTPPPEPIEWKTEVDPVNPPTEGKKLKGVYVVDKDYLMVHFVDGEVIFHEDTSGDCAYEFCNEADANTVVTYGEPLDTAAASSPWQWHITSTDDASYGSQGQDPEAAHRKSKLNGMAQLQWSGNDFVYEPTMEHWVYLKLPTSMQPGKTYSVQIGEATNTDIDHWTFTYDIFNSPTEALHVNLAGYHPQAAIQAADLYMWMGDGGGRDYSEFAGNSVYLYNVDTDTAQEVGQVSFWQKSASEAQRYNFTRTDVWNVDFTGNYAPGTYRLAVEGVGSSADFTIGAEALQDPFQVSTLGYFYMRMGQDNLDMTPVPRRPLWIPGQSPSDTRILITDMDPYHPDWTAGGGDRWDQPQFFAQYVKAGSPENTVATGGHSDAADSDRHLGHVSNIYDMLLPYILTDGAIGSDSLGIAESGNGVPDIIDEARNEVDFWLALRYNGGYSHGLTNPDSSSHILYQADNTTVAAWANAANAAMIASAYRIAGEGALAAHYLDEAEEAWTYASNSSDLELENSQEVGGGDMTGRDFRIMAAAWLYHLTGNTAYENIVEADSLVTSSRSEFLTSSRNQLYAVAAYLTTDQPINYPSLKDNMRASVIYQAKNKETRYMDSRPSRRSTDNDQGYFHTAQFVTRSILAHAVSTTAADRQHFEEALQLEADWGLGRNPSNMIQMTTATTALADMRSVENCYTSGRNDGTPGLHPGHTPYLNIDDWGSMIMASPSWMADKLYPKASGWPRGEIYFNTRWVWAHSEFTPRQTMRGKMALYGYLLGIKQN